jgi:hypothetical protein
MAALYAQVRRHGAGDHYFATMDKMPDQATIQAISIATTVALAFVGYIITYSNNLRADNRKARVGFISDQLQYLYGPLFSMSQAASEAWDSFRSKCRPDGSFFDDSPPPTSDELVQWRLWMSEVFMPINLKMETIVIDNAHLIEGTEMPKPFQDLLSHVEAYKPVMKKWTNGDFSEHTSSLNFPDDFGDYVSRTFQSLKRRQSELIGTTGKIVPH